MFAIFPFASPSVFRCTIYGRAALAKSVNLFFVRGEVIEQVNMICGGVVNMQRLW